MASFRFIDLVHHPGRNGFPEYPQLIAFCEEVLSHGNGKGSVRWIAVIQHMGVKQMILKSSETDQLCNTKKY